ncbi:MAG: hypothetical protein Q8L29_04595 [archaeon]|nr:hypothetical protein [archaeon]
MKKIKKGTKKQFFEVIAPITSTKISLYASAPEELNGKVITIDLTRSLRGRSFVMRLKVKAEGEKLTAEPVSVELAGSYIRRMFRKGVDYVEDSFETACRDKKAVIKFFMLTRNKVSREIIKKIRNDAREYLINYAKIRDSKEILTDIMTNKIQKEVSFKVKKIYPLALCEIRVFKILEEKK